MGEHRKTHRAGEVADDIDGYYGESGQPLSLPVRIKRSGNHVVQMGKVEL